MPYYEYEEYRRTSRPADEARDDPRLSNVSPRPIDSPARLEPPSTNARPRSVPPYAAGAIVPRRRSPSPEWSDDDYDDRYDRRRGGTRDISRGRHDLDDDDSDNKARNRSPSPLGKARSVIQDNFTNSTVGIGAGLIGAVVGGYAAREASNAALKHKRKGQRGRARSHDGRDDTTALMVSTLLGAVAGGLGANALANHVEDSRDKDRAEQHAWESKHGREEDLPKYDDGRARMEREYRRGGQRALLPPPDDDEYDVVEMRDYDDGVYDDDRRRDGRYRREEDYDRKRW